jgi:hypothetical protein
MGGQTSKGSNDKKSSHFSGDRWHQQNIDETIQPNHMQSETTTGDKQRDELDNSFEGTSNMNNGDESSDDEFYDGIPRFSRDHSIKKGSRVGRARSLGLEKAVDVLDKLGSSMTNLNTRNGFASGVNMKGNALSILSFEVANTIVKGQTLLLSVSERSIRRLTEKVLPTEGIRHLVSENIDDLLRIVASDKREELKLFAGEVVRFGNRCRDPQWHNLDLFFEKHSKEPPKSKEHVESTMLQLMTIVQQTAELYSKLNMLDRLEQDQLLKYQLTHVSNKKGDHRDDALNQKKQVRNLKKKSLWSRSMEEVMGKLVDIVHFLNHEIRNAFPTSDDSTTLNDSLNLQQRLGPSGLSLHYANIVLMIDSLVVRSNSMMLSSRDVLYQSLPPHVKSALRSKLQSFHVKEEFTVTEIKAEMEKTLHWLVPISMNTARAHHGFGWVGEWGGTGSEANRRSTVVTDVIRIDTLHYADKDKTEAYVMELLLWLNQLIVQTKSSVKSASNS